MVAALRSEEEECRIQVGRLASLEGHLSVPAGARGVVLFAHGSGSSRHSPRNRYVAWTLREAGLATLLIDLLTSQEESLDSRSGRYRFNIALLAERIADASEWLSQHTPADWPIGYFGASTGAGAALVAAAQRPQRVGAIVSRGGRPDLAGPWLPKVRAPTLLIVGGGDLPVIELNQQALEQLGSAKKRLVLVPRATHLFEEPGALEEVGRLAADWFARHLQEEEE